MMMYFGPKVLPAVTLIFSVIVLFALRSRNVTNTLKSSSDICFTQHDFNRMFTAKVSSPDSQLAVYLEATKPTRHYPTFPELLNTMYHTQTSIYANFTSPDLPEMAVYNGGTTQHTVEFLSELHPEPIKFMLEVGSFIGSSATNFGKFLRQSGAGLLLCIDTWNGDINMILNRNFASPMARTPQGDSRLYARFLNRMVAEGLVDTVLPLRLSSITGARLVRTLEYNVDAIYLDSAHEYGETFLELMMYW